MRLRYLAAPILAAVAIAAGASPEEPWTLRLIESGGELGSKVLWLDEQGVRWASQASIEDSAADLGALDVAPGRAAQSLWSRSEEAVRAIAAQDVGRAHPA